MLASTPHGILQSLFVKVPVLMYISFYLHCITCVYCGLILLPSLIPRLLPMPKSMGRSLGARLPFALAKSKLHLEFWGL